MFGLTWTQIWALATRADEMTALATDLAEVLNKHRPIIDHVLNTLDETPERVGHNPKVIEERARDKIVDLIDRSKNVDNN